MADSTIYELELPGTPPSLNEVAARSNRWRFINAKKSWEGLIGIGLMAAKVPRGLEKANATAVLTFPQRRRRDEGNFRVVLEKALGDILVTGGWLPDDDADRFSFGKLVIDPDPGTALTRIALEVERAEAG